MLCDSHSFLSICCLFYTERMRPFVQLLLCCGTAPSWQRLPGKVPSSVWAKPQAASCLRETQTKASFNLGFAAVAQHCLNDVLFLLSAFRQPEGYVAVAAQAQQFGAVIGVALWISTQGLIGAPGRPRFCL